MASIYDLKPAFQNLLQPATRALAGWGVSANQVTLFAVVLSLVEGAALLIWPGSPGPLLCLPAVLLVRMSLNAIDGMLAREHGMKSALGAYLNEMGDVVSDAALYLPIALVPRISAPLMVLLVVLAAMSEMAGVVSIQIGGTRRYDGPMGKSDRALVFGVIGLALGLGFRGFVWVNLVLAAVVALLAVTILNRARGALRGGSSGG